jgi:HTH-like domain
MHARSRGPYGVPRMHAELAAARVRIGRKRVARLMRSVGVQRESSEGPADHAPRFDRRPRAPSGQPRLRGGWARSAVGGKLNLPMLGLGAPAQGEGGSRTVADATGG